VRSKVTRSASIFACVTASLFLAVPASLHAQGGRGGGRGGPPPTAKSAAPIDLTGYWVSVITEDWHTRMLTAPKGDFGSGIPGATAGFGGQAAASKEDPAKGGNIPYNKAGGQLAFAWDPAKDEADGNQCRAYGAPGVLRQPGRLHITWEDDNTLRIDTDAGTQTRLLHVKAPQAQGGRGGPPEGDLRPEPPSGAPSWQGNSVGRWVILGGGRADWPRGGNLEVVTNNLKPGYYWKNGMPYSANAVLTERFRVTKEDNGDVWLNFWQKVDDPQYLTEPYIVNYQFKKQADAKGWNPTPCTTR
jgi:hypothetical protein